MACEIGNKWLYSVLQPGFPQKSMKPSCAFPIHIYIYIYIYIYMNESLLKNSHMTSNQLLMIFWPTGTKHCSTDGRRLWAARVTTLKKLTSFVHILWEHPGQPMNFSDVSRVCVCAYKVDWKVHNIKVHIYTESGGVVRYCRGTLG